MTPRLRTALARLVGAASRATGRGGTSLPGKVLLRMEPDALRRLAGRLEHGSTVISATNGKTTTAAMAATILGDAGYALVHNRAGANMAGGIATALLDAPDAGPVGAPRGELGLFEVDEFWLDRVLGDVQPRVALLGNLFRDQLDRYGELETIAARWAAAIDARPAQALGLALNADDPLVADLGRGRGRVLYFGVEDDGMALAQMAHAADSKHCRRCGHPYRYEAVYLGHLGRYRCPNCGAERPRPELVATDVQLEGVRGASFTLTHGEARERVRLALPGLYNVYNALGAVALALALGVSLDGAATSLRGVRPAFGRSESVRLGEHELIILLVKNPAGANEVLRTLALEPGDHDLLVVLNDRIADGRDVSWVWDADFEALAGRTRRVTVSGTRAAEMAVRMKYAGLDGARITVVEELGRALDGALAGAEEDRPVYALPTYTAMLELRDVLARRGEVASSWA